MEKSGGSSPASDTERENSRLELKEKEDRISDLPDSIIQHILSFLPSTKEAIQTGILSKRLRNQWTRVPILIFYSFGEFNKDFCQFIDKTLALHDCPRLKKFHIQYDYLDELKLHQKVNFAARKYVEELILQCYFYDDEFKLPKSVINNSFLVKLELINCHLNTKWKPNWPCLKELKLNSHTLRFTAIQNAVCGSPLLESLELTKCSAVNGHVLVSKSLKRLSFVDVNCHNKHLGFSCPNVEELSFRASDFLYTNLNRKTIECALSGCPILRSLELRNFLCDELVIDSHSLKKIVLQESDKCCPIEIVCPNLEELNLYSLAIGSLKVVNLPSSSSVGVDRDVIVSKSTKRLSIVDVDFDDSDDLVKILWPHLEELSVRALRLGSTMSSQAIEYLLAGCQLLRSLELRNYFWNDELVIASNSLKKLVLEENVGCCAVEISCPNLEELCLYALRIKSLKVMNLPSSVSASVNLDFDVCNENVAKQIDEQFQHVKKLKFAK